MRFPDEEVCRLPRKCGVCGTKGHDRRNCPQRASVNKTVEEIRVEGSADTPPSDIEDSHVNVEEEEPTHTQSLVGAHKRA